MIPSRSTAGTVRGRRRPGAAGLFRATLVFLLLAQVAGAKPPCVPACDFCLDDPCLDFEDCKERANGELYQVCLDRCRPPGKFPSFEQGRCTIIRECVAKCRAKRGVNLGDCKQSLRSGVRGACTPGEKCRLSSNAATRLCRDCVLGTPATPPAPAVVPLAASGSQCQAACIQRNAGDCFLKCTERCKGDLDATRLCGEGCGDANCNLLIRKCTLPDDTSDTQALSQRDSQYLLCCGPDFSGCEEDDAESIGCEATTTSTTVTSTTQTTGTTSTTSTTRITGATAGS